MSGLYVMQLASQEASWLTARQSLIASNVANANTPGYHARDLTPFEISRENVHLSLAATNPLHLISGGPDISGTSVVEQSSSETLSGNSVNLEQQMMHLGEVNRAYTLNMNIKRAIHQMLISVVK